MRRLINVNVVALKDGIGRHVHRSSEVLGALCVLRARVKKCLTQIAQMNHGLAQIRVTRHCCFPRICADPLFICQSALKLRFGMV